MVVTNKGKENKLRDGSDFGQYLFRHPKVGTGTDHSPMRTI
jgi:hypothetical protein